MSTGDGKPKDEQEPRVGFFKQALARALVDGRLPRWLVPSLHRRILEQRAWRAEYEALRHAERLAAGAPAVTQSQVDLLETLVLHEVQGVSETRGPVYAWVAAAAAMCVLVGILFQALPSGPETTDPAWRVRRADGDAPRLGLKLRCVAPDRSRVLAAAEAGARQLEDRLSCPHGGLLSFSVTNLDEAPRYLFAVGVSDEAELRWYAPFTRTSRSVKVEPGEVDRLLETLADTSELPDDDRVSLFVLYSSRPLSGHEIEAQLARAPTRQHLQKAARLPVEAEVQARIELQTDVEPR